jgi:hypothetical protein
MASAAQTLANNDKKKLSANQLAILMQASGNSSESLLQSDYGQLLKIYCDCPPSVSY